MITLITGVPGTGKTSLAVSLMMAEKNRPFFVMGIPELAVPHSPVPPVEQWVEMRPDQDDASILLPYFTFPPHSIIVIDEAQRIYRPRAAGQKVPPIVAAFETHRHTGVDFWLLTQGPALLDANIRRLVTRHLHIHPTPFGRKLLEWSQCRDPDNKTDRGDALKKSYSPPPEAFGQYKSAEVHTKVKRGLPKSAVVAVAAVFLALGLSLYAYQRISLRLSKDSPQAATQPIGSPQPAPVKMSPSQPGPKADTGNQLVNYLDRFTPVHPNHPESAPAYDAIRVVKAMPIISGCIKTATFCRCYSQQSTVLDVQPERCAAIVANKVFDPYRPDPIALASAEAAKTAAGVTPPAKLVQPPSVSIPAPQDPQPAPSALPGLKAR